MATRLSLKIFAVILFLLALQMGVFWFFVCGRYASRQSSAVLQVLYSGGKSDRKVFRDGKSVSDVSRHGESVSMISRGNESESENTLSYSWMLEEDRAVPLAADLLSVRGKPASRVGSPGAEGAVPSADGLDFQRGRGKANMNSPNSLEIDHSLQKTNVDIPPGLVDVEPKSYPIHTANTSLSVDTKRFSPKVHTTMSPSNDAEPRHPKLRTSTSTHNSSQPQNTGNWKEGTFCDKFLAKTFQLKTPVCSTLNKSRLMESVECFGNPHTSSMGTCTLRNVAVLPSVLMRIMDDPDRPKFETNQNPISLLRGLGSECRDMTINNLSQRVEGGDYVLKVVKGIMAYNKTESTSVCKAWINETAFFFTAHRFHIYFRFLDYYNVHKLVGDTKYSTASSGSRIIRISGSDNYHFPEFDQALFPEAKVQALEDLHGTKTCFREVVLVPKSYASPIFQCKNRASLRAKCMECDGKGLNETDIRKFRDRVIRACSSRVKLPSNGDKSKLIVMVSRKPYLRNQNDKLDHFERVLDNEEELLRALREAFQNVTVRVVHLENLTICEQIAYGHNADVYLGVHGSGLVHLWWMRDDALLYEMEPHYQIGNPTFRMLSQLAGRNYHSEFIGGGFRTVHTNVRSVVENIRKYSNL